MAPQRTTPGDPPTVHAVKGSRVAKPKHGNNTRGREHGVTDLARKGWKFEIPEQNAQQSPLLRLPAEVRNQIWELALGGYTLEVTGSAPRNSNKPSNRFRALNGPRNCLALLQTCRQVHAETAMLPFELNTFTFGIFPVDAMFALRAYGHDSIRHIRIQTSTWSQYEYSHIYLSALTSTIGRLSRGLKSVKITVTTGGMDNPQKHKLQQQVRFEPYIKGLLDRDIKVDFVHG